MLAIFITCHTILLHKFFLICGFSFEIEKKIPCSRFSIQLGKKEEEEKKKSRLGLALGNLEMSYCSQGSKHQ